MVCVIMHVARMLSYTHRRSKFGAGVPVKGRREPST